MVADLTGLPIAGASLLDEATAVAEAMTLARRTTKTGTGPAARRRHPAADHRGRPDPGRGARHSRSRWPTVRCSTRVAATDPFAVVVQTPGASGRLARHRRALRRSPSAAHAKGAEVIAACDLLALTLTTPPGEWGADIAVGSSQRFGVPLFYGGPHAGFISVREGLERTLPGRLVGVSRDADGTPAYRLALQTREQHIRREKATSNICTAQVLLAVTASMYAVYHGPARTGRGSPQAVHDAAPVAGRRPDGRRRRGGARRVLRHRAGSGAGRGRRRRRARPASSACTCGWSTPTTWASRSARTSTRADLTAVRDRVRRRGRRPDGVRRSRLGAQRTSALPDPPGVQHPPQRDGDAALPAGAVRPRLRARPRA